MGFIDMKIVTQDLVQKIYAKGAFDARRENMIMPILTSAEAEALRTDSFYSDHKVRRIIKGCFISFFLARNRGTQHAGNPYVSHKQLNSLINMIITDLKKQSNFLKTLMNQQHREAKMKHNFLLMIKRALYNRENIEEILNILLERYEQQMRESEVK